MAFKNFCLKEIKFWKGLAIKALIKTSKEVKGF